jgi:ribosomal protein S7
MQNQRTQTVKPFQVLTTPELLAELEVHRFVDQLMAEGKASRRAGWVMTEILEQVEQRFGSGYVETARQYIVETVCGYITL